MDNGMKIGLCQAEFPEDVQAALVGGWCGDYMQSYRWDRYREWLAAIREAGQLAVPSITPPILAHWEKYVGLFLENADILHGVNLEFDLEDARLALILDALGRQRCIVYDDNLRNRGDVWRYSRSWYSHQRAEKPPPEARTSKAVRALYWTAKNEVCRQPLSYYCLYQAVNVQRKRKVDVDVEQPQRPVEVELWLGAYGWPAVNPAKSDAEGHASNIQTVQPRIDAMLEQMLVCDRFGIPAVQWYTYSQIRGGQRATMPDSHPRMWAELCQAVRSYRTGEVPQIWKCEHDWLRS